MMLLCFCREGKYSILFSFILFYSILFYLPTERKLEAYAKATRLRKSPKLPNRRWRGEVSVLVAVNLIIC